MKTKYAKFFKLWRIAVSPIGRMLSFFMFSFRSLFITYASKTLGNLTSWIYVSSEILLLVGQL